jgi:hypothetical protein
LANGNKDLKVNLVDNSTNCVKFTYDGDKFEINGDVLIKNKIGFWQSIFGFKNTKRSTKLSTKRSTKNIKV